MMYTIIHKNLKIEQHEAHQAQGVISGAPEGSAISPPHVPPMGLLFSESR